MGIAEHVRGLKQGEIRAAIALPSEEKESVLQVILDEVENVLREAHSCFQSSQVEMLGKTRAFEPDKEPATLKTYFKLVK